MKLDFESVQVVVQAYDAWRGRRHTAAKQIVAATTADQPIKPGKSVKPKPEDGVEILCAALIFLTALLQGCVLAVFEKHLRKRFPEIDDSAKLNRYLSLIGANGNGANPNEANINRLFARIGIIDVLDGFTCGGAQSEDVQKLNDLTSIRNQIAHGAVQYAYVLGNSTYTINRLGIDDWVRFVKRFAKAFESHVEGKLA